MQALLNLLSAIALLVWGAHIARTGVIRVWGGGLRKTLVASTSTRSQALLAGLGVKVLFASHSGHPMLDMPIGALFTVFCYASLAVVLPTATLAGSDVISVALLAASARFPG
jgi:phosphate:Na+ symporter